MSKLLLVTSDLMLLSRLERVVHECPLTKVVAANAAQAISDCDNEVAVTIIDLQTPGLEIADLVTGLRERNSQIAIVAAGPHVHERKLQQAREAGCDVVVSRGQLDREIEQIVKGLL